MTHDELACWVADTTPGRLAHGSVRWRALHDRALQAIEMIEEGTLNRAADIALAIDSGRGNEKEIASAIRALKGET